LDRIPLQPSFLYSISESESNLADQNSGGKIIKHFPFIKLKQ
jgi:hypothetical protein